MHPIHKHMSSRRMARKADERYDAKEAYNKNLSGKARLHYLENDIHDKGMSMKAPMDMKGPMDMKSPVKKHHGSPADMKAPMRKEGKYSGNQPDLAGYKKDKQEKKDLMDDNPVVKDASGKRRPAKESKSTFVAGKRK